MKRLQWAVSAVEVKPNINETSSSLSGANEAMKALPLVKYRRLLNHFNASDPYVRIFDIMRARSNLMLPVIKNCLKLFIFI